MACPRLCLRGQGGHADPYRSSQILGEYIEIVGRVGASKSRNARAAVDDVRGGEVHFIEEVDAAEESMRKAVELIVAPGVARDRGFRGSGQFRPA